MILACTCHNCIIVVAESTDSVHSSLKNTPVGPVTGAVLGAILVIVLAVYCYRHSIRRQPLTDTVIHDNGPYNGCYNQDIDGYVYHELPAVPGPSAAVPGWLLIAYNDTSTNAVNCIATWFTKIY